MLFLLGPISRGKKMNELLWVIPGKPLSTNRRFTVARNSHRMVKTNQTRQYETALQRLFGANRNINKFNELHTPTSEYRLMIGIHFPHFEYFTKSGSIKQNTLDIPNTIKSIEDSLSKALRINDAHNSFVIVEKHEADDDWVVIVNYARLTG